MKSTVEQLTTQERTALALFYDTPAYRALKRLLELGRLNTATKLLELDPTIHHTIMAQHQGRAMFAKELNQEIKHNYKEYVRTEESNQKRRKAKS